jgi:hypothetical protein
MVACYASSDIKICPHPEIGTSKKFTEDKLSKQFNSEGPFFVFNIENLALLTKSMYCKKESTPIRD